METTESECLDALRAAASELGESPTKAQYEDLGFTPAAGTIIRVLGGWNEAKERAGLETNPSRGPRVEPKPDDVTIPDGERWDDLTHDQRWHYKHVARNTRRSLQRRDEHRAWLYERKHECGGCQRCDEADPACLDFHHVDPDEKTMEINQMVSYGYGRDRIERELDGCIVLCANCHVRIHDEHDESVNSTTSATARPLYSDVEPPATRAELRAWARAERARNGCQACPASDPRVLTFHHRSSETKDRGVGALVSHGATFETVRAEVAKCTVLCHNCHRKRHYTAPNRVRENDSV